MKKLGYLIAALAAIPYCLQAQKSIDSTNYVDSFARVNKKVFNKNTTVAAVILAGVGTHAVLYSTWYSNNKLKSFHWKNDNKDWLQMDKMGHAWSSFTLSEVCTEFYIYGGYSPNKAANLGLISSLVFQTSIEYFDGRSIEWGASYGDILANTAGSLWSWGQRKLWNKVKIPLKYTVQGSKYANIRPSMLGKNIPERMLKDYNGQTYWLTFQGNKFNFGKNWPKWLGFAIGYGATGMLGGSDNIFTDNIQVTRDYSYLPRLRQFYFSPHISLSHLKSKNKGINVVFTLTDLIRLPLPNIEINNKGNVKFNLFSY